MSAALRGFLHLKYKKVPPRFQQNFGHVDLCYNLNNKRKIGIITLLIVLNGTLNMSNK